MFNTATTNAITITITTFNGGSINEVNNGVGVGVGVTGGGAVGVTTDVGDGVGAALSAKSTKMEKWSTYATALSPTIVVGSAFHAPASKTYITGVVPRGKSAESNVMEISTGALNLAPDGPSSIA